MKLYDKDFTAIGMLAKTNEALRRQHTENLMDSISQAAAFGRKEVTVDGLRPDEQQGLLEAGFDVDSVGDRWWISWAEA